MQHPFDLSNDEHYSTWRQNKLDNYLSSQSKSIVHLTDLTNLTIDEIQTLKLCCSKNNFVIYQSEIIPDPTDLLSFCQQLGLNRIIRNPESDKNGISALEANQESLYIPYTNKALNWHTDGYYNATERVSAFLLHCQQPAFSGGENAILDHEIAYILLRDKHPEYIKALMSESALTIPANQKDPEQIRQKSVGAVYTICSDGALHMRYTARSRSVEWHNNPWLDQARQALLDILSHSELIIRHTLTANQGLICNNPLHSRTSFTDTTEQSRLLYRLRFADTITT